MSVLKFSHALQKLSEGTIVRAGIQLSIPVEREKRRLRTLENRVLRRISGYKTEEVTRD
jgi:hypothetical protein